MPGQTARIGTVAAALAAVVIGTGTAFASMPPGWHIQSTVGKPTGQTAITSVVATGSRNAWAVGYTKPGGPVLIERWSGRRWSKVAGPAHLVASSTVLAASSAKDAWLEAAGKDYQWNGVRWRPVFMPAWVDRAARAGLPNQSIADFSRTDVWQFSSDAASQPDLAARYDGHKWLKERLPAAPAIVGWQSSTSIWALGENLATRHVVLMRFNGHSWTTRNVPTPRLPSGTDLIYGAGTGLVVAGANNVWVQAGSTLWHFINGHWGSSTVPNPGGISVVGIVSDGHGGLWLPSFTTGSNPTEYFSHLSAGHWTKATLPSEDGQQPLIEGLALVPGTRSDWAVGPLPTGATGSGTTVGAFLQYQP